MPLTTRPLVGLSLIPEDDFRLASFPLFEAGEVEILEWSFDMGWGPNSVPDWKRALINYYSEAERLIGHGVTFSALSAEWTPRQDHWLECFREEMQSRHYLHLSEHFGFCAAGSFHQSAPLPVPLSETTLRIGHDRLQKLNDLVSVPVGLENLAFAFGLRDVQQQGEFLERLLEPTNGFVLLDLHNIYCQMCNFDLSAEAILESYPLRRVRELHVSGGSWSESQIQDTSPVRRDTHDEAVPENLWPLLEMALKKCQNVQAVIFERLGNTIYQETDAEQFREDFRRLSKIVSSHESSS